MSSVSCSVCLEDFKYNDKYKYCNECKEKRVCENCYNILVKQTKKIWINPEEWIDVFKHRSNFPKCPCCRTPYWKMLRFAEITQMIDHTIWNEQLQILGFVNNSLPIAKYIFNEYTRNNPNEETHLDKPFKDITYEEYVA